MIYSINKNDFSKEKKDYLFYQQIHNTKMIEPKTPISTYKDQQSNQSPPIPNIFRSRHKIQPQNNEHISSNQKYFIHPKQIIIDAFKYNQQHPSKQEYVSCFPQEGIRNQIDLCLNAVAKVHKQQAKRKGSRVQPTQNWKDPLTPMISNNSIHRVDTNLIMKYIGTIDKDYGLQNRFSDIKVNIISNQRLNPSNQQIKNPQDKYGSIERTRGKSRKSFINLTLSTNKEKRQNSITKQKFNTTHPKLSPNNTYSSHHNKNIQRSSSSAQVPTKTQLIQKIPQDFKYCINCEQPILVKNIEYHQKNQCKQLTNLYQLSFIQLRDFIHKKISKIKQQIHQKIKKLKNIQKNHSQEFPSIDLKDGFCQTVIRNIQNYLKQVSSQQLSGSRTKNYYHNFKQSLKHQFFQCVNMTHKLDYFIKIYIKLNDESTLPLTLSKQSSYELIIKNVDPVDIQRRTQQIINNQYKKQVNNTNPTNMSIITPFHADQ